MKTTVPWFASLALLSASAPAFADDCAAIDIALRAAPGQMASLKMGLYGKLTADTFNTSWRIGGAGMNDCMVSYFEPTGYDVSCMIDASSRSEAIATGEEMMATISACLDELGEKYVVEPWSERKGGRRDHEGVFRVQHSATNDIDITVSAGCRVNKKNRERCSTHVLVELVGDERE